MYTRNLYFISLWEVKLITWYAAKVSVTGWWSMTIIALCQFCINFSKIKVMSGIIPGEQLQVVLLDGEVDVEKLKHLGSVFVANSQGTEEIRSNTVRLLIHVHCKPTQFFFHSFIATMSYCLQTSFNSVMKDWADKYHVSGTPTRSPSRPRSQHLLRFHEFLRIFRSTKTEKLL